MAKRQRNSFLTPLVVEVQPSGKTFKIAREFTFKWARRSLGIHIDPGFITDFASIPWGCRLIIPKLGKHTKASVIHDYLYQHHRVELTPEAERLIRCRVNISDMMEIAFIFNRGMADLCFRDGMKELGVKPWKYWLMWLAVRLFGWLAWRR